MRSCFAGKERVEATGATVGEVMAKLRDRYPDSRWHVFSEDGEIHVFLGVFLNDLDVRVMEGLDTPVKPGDRIHLVPTSGGG